MRVNVPAMLAAYRADVETALGLLGVTAATVAGGPVAHATLAGEVRAALDRLDASQPMLARQDTAAAALLAHETLTIDGLLARFNRRLHHTTRRWRRKVSRP